VALATAPVLVTVKTVGADGRVAIVVGNVTVVVPDAPGETVTFAPAILVPVMAMDAPTPVEATVTVPLEAAAPGVRG
jgi:hypothetical protein